MTPRQTTLTGAIPDTRIYSIGYGGRTLPEIIKILSAKNVEKLVDVRSYPNTKWFGKSHLESKLGDNYISIPELGGIKYSVHQYKDWIAKVQKKTLDDLVELAEQHVICIICAENNHSNCHRSYFVSRVLKEKYGLEVCHI